MLNKIKGGLFGVAVGDALGCTTEFMTPDIIQRKYGTLTDIIGGGTFQFEKGEVTDDTDMTLCVARGILQNPTDPLSSIGQEFVNWFNSGPKDIGISTQLAIRYFKHSRDWEKASQTAHAYTDEKSAGNGSLMRCLPIALVYSKPSQLLTLSMAQSKLTHWDQKAARCCVLYNRIAYRLLQGEELHEAIREEVEGTEFLSSLYEKPMSNPDGYVINTMNWTVYLLTHTTSYEEAIIQAVNLGYDADTTAAVVGGLAGIHYGYENIPTRWINELLLKNEFDQLANQLHDIRH